MKTNILSFAEEIIYQSLYDRLYNPLPQDQKEQVFTQVVNVLNYVLDESIDKMPFEQYKKFSAQSIESRDNYGVLTVDFTEIISIQVIQSNNNLAYFLKHLPIDQLLLLQSSPIYSPYVEYYAFDAHQRELLFFPYQSIDMTLFGRKAFEPFKLSVTKDEAGVIYNITPFEFNLKHQGAFLEYVKLKCAKILCENNNTDFSNMLSSRLIQLEKSLSQRRKMMMRSVDCGSQKRRLLHQLTNR